MSGSKYFVWAEGRWRELDVRAGRVEGWSRRPRFVFVQRGRLRVAARRRVLSALDALAAHKPSAASVGSRLSARSIESGSRTRTKALLESPPASAPAAPAVPLACAHQHCCCMHINGCYNNNNIKKIAADISSAPSQQALTSSQPHRADVATQHRTDVTQNRAHAATQILPDADTQSRTDAATQSRSTRPIYINLLNHPVQIRPPEIRPPEVRLTEIRPPDIRSQEVRPPEVRPARIRSPESRPKRVQSPEVRSPPGQPSTGQVKRQAVRNNGPRLETLLKRARPLKRTHTDTQTSDDSSQHFRKKPRRSGPQRKSITGSNRRGSRRNRSLSNSSSSSVQQNVCKELVVSVPDIVALRSYVKRTRPRALERFDYDDGFKRELFYSINPLVDVTRCPRTERALRERHDLARAPFAARLGLAPRGAARHARHRQRTSSDNDKENRHATDESRSKKNKSPATTKSQHKRAIQHTNGNDTPRISGEHKRVTPRNSDAQTTRKSDAQITRKSDAQNQHAAGDNGDQSDTTQPPRENKRNSLRKRTVNVPTKHKRDVTTQFSNAHRVIALANNRPGEDTSSGDESTSTESTNATFIKGSQRTNSTACRPNVVTVEESSSESSAASSADRRSSLRSRSEVTKAKAGTSNARKENDKRKLPLVNGTNETDSESGNDFRAVRTRMSGARSVESDQSEEKPSSSSGNSSNGVGRRLSVVKSKGRVGKKSPSATAAGSAAPAHKSAAHAPATAAGDKQLHTHVISKRVSGNTSKEYSNLEDHAIVSWVSCGARARLVNGNRLWRELQESFPRLAGRARSWHSLRNRYLRYILPGLGALRLPPADVSRLRAAAATGEVKSKRGGAGRSRRNSIFEENTARAASARRPPAPASIAPHSTHATRSLRPRDSNATPSPAPHAAGPTAGPSAAPTAGPSGARSRKLFNPKLVF